MSRASSEEQLHFLLKCVKHSNNGKVDFQEVAKECNIVSKGAAAKRYERMMKANGISPYGNGGGEASTPASSPATKTPKSGSKAGAGPKTPNSKKRKIADEGIVDSSPLQNDNEDGFYEAVKEEGTGLDGVQEEDGVGTFGLWNHNQYAGMNVLKSELNGATGWGGLGQPLHSASQGIKHDPVDSFMSGMEPPTTTMMSYTQLPEHHINTYMRKVAIPTEKNTYITYNHDLIKSEPRGMSRQKTPDMLDQYLNSQVFDNGSASQAVGGSDAGAYISEARVMTPSGHGLDVGDATVGDVIGHTVPGDF